MPCSVRTAAFLDWTQLVLLQCNSGLAHQALFHTKSAPVHVIPLEDRCPLYIMPCSVRTAAFLDWTQLVLLQCNSGLAAA